MTEPWCFRTGVLQSHGCLEAKHFQISSAEEQQGSSAAQELCSLHSNSDFEEQVFQAGQPALLRWSGGLRWLRWFSVEFPRSGDRCVATYRGNSSFLESRYALRDFSITLKLRLHASAQGREGGEGGGGGRATTETSKSAAAAAGVGRVGNGRACNTQLEAVHLQGAQFRQSKTESAHNMNTH